MSTEDDVVAAEGRRIMLESTRILLMAGAQTYDPNDLRSNYSQPLSRILRPLHHCTKSHLLNAHFVRDFLKQLQLVAELTKLLLIYTELIRRGAIATTAPFNVIQ